MGFDPATELFVQSLDGVASPRGFPLRRVEAPEGEKAISCLFQAVSDRPAFQAPFAQKGLAALLHLGRRFGIDYVAISTRQSKPSGDLLTKTTCDILFVGLRVWADRMTASG